MSGFEDPFESRVFRLGMRLMQKACKARASNNLALAQQYQKQFFELCEAIQTKPLKEVAHQNADDDIESLNRINGSRLVLLSEYNNTRATKSEAATKEVAAAYKQSQNACIVLTSYLSRGLPPPPLEMKSVSVRRPLMDSSIRPDELVIRITSLQAEKDKGRQYTFLAYPPGRSPNPHTSEAVEPGKCDVEFKFPVISRANLDRLLRQSAILEIRVQRKRAFGRVDLFSAAAVKIPLSLLAGTREIHKDYVMTNNEEAPTKNEVFGVGVTMAVQTALQYPEMEDRDIGYVTLAANAKVNLPKPKRTIADLSPAEKATLTAALKSLRLLQPWELSRWSGLSILKAEITATKAVIDKFEALQVDPPQKAVAQYELLAKTQATLIDALKTKKIPLDAYKEKLKSQSQADANEAKEKGLKSPEGQILLNRIKLMKDEFAAMAAK